MEEIEECRTCSMHGAGKKNYYNAVKKTLKGKRPFGRLRYSWEYDTELILGR
jgi:hypothetical protein